MAAFFVADCGHVQGALAAARESAGISPLPSLNGRQRPAMRCDVLGLIRGDATMSPARHVTSAPCHQRAMSPARHVTRAPKPLSIPPSNPPCHQNMFSRHSP